MSAAPAPGVPGPPCQRRRGPGLRLSAAAGAREPWRRSQGPRSSSFPTAAASPALPGPAGAPHSCGTRERPHGRPLSPGRPSSRAPDPVTSFLAPTSRSTEPSAAARGTCDAARGRPQTHRPDGGWDWGGEGELCFERQRPLRRRKPTRPPQAKWGGGGSGNWRGWGREAHAQAPSTAPYLCGRREMESRRGRETDERRGRRTTNPRRPRARLRGREAPAEARATGSGSPGQRLPDQEAWEIESWALWAPWAARPAPALRSVPAALPHRSGARGSSLPPRGPTLPQATPLHPGPPGRPATQLAQEQACVEVWPGGEGLRSGVLGRRGAGRRAR